jgi:hypothetical protein
LLPLLVIAMASGCSFHSSSSGSSGPTGGSTPPPPPTSSELATSEMWPSMSAQSDGQTLKVYASVLEGSDFVDLDTGDFFVANVQGGESGIVLTKEPATPGKIHYFATFPAPQGASTVTIDFMRQHGFQSAPSSVTTVPAPFTITSAAPTSVRWGTVLSLTVSPPPVISNAAMEQMTVAVSGACIQSADPFPVTFDTAGNAAFQTALLKPNPGTNTGCDLNVQVRHEFNGPADAAFANAGSNPVLGLQQRDFQTSLTF